MQTRQATQAPTRRATGQHATAVDQRTCAHDWHGGQRTRTVQVCATCGLDTHGEMTRWIGRLAREAGEAQRERDAARAALRRGRRLAVVGALVLGAVAVLTAARARKG